MLIEVLMYSVAVIKLLHAAVVKAELRVLLGLSVRDQLLSQQMDPVHMSEGAVFFSFYFFPPPTHTDKVSRKVTLNLDVSSCSAINPQFPKCLLGDSAILPQANQKQAFPCETIAEADLVFGNKKKSAALCNCANMQSPVLAVLLSLLIKKQTKTE